MGGQNILCVSNEILVEYSEIIGKIDIIGIEDFCKHYFPVH